MVERSATALRRLAVVAVPAFRDRDAGLAGAVARDVPGVGRAAFAGLAALAAAVARADRGAFERAGVPAGFDVLTAFRPDALALVFVFAALAVVFVVFFAMAFDPVGKRSAGSRGSIAGKSHYIREVYRRRRGDILDPAAVGAKTAPRIQEGCECRTSAVRHVRR